jgi:hypothetical protein
VTAPTSCSGPLPLPVSVKRLKSAKRSVVRENPTESPYHRSVSLLHALALTATAVAAPHDGPPVFLQATVAEGRVSVTFSAEQMVALPWLGESGRFAPPLDDVTRSRVEQAAEALLNKELHVTIDGVAVRLAGIDNVQVFNDFGPDNSEASIQVDAHFACSGTPRSVGFVWQYYEDVEDGKRKLPLVIAAEGDFEFKVLIEDEPAYTWRAQGAPADSEPGPQAPAPAADSRSGAWGILMAGLFGSVLLLRVGRRRYAVVASATCATLALLLWTRGPSELERPRDDPARTIFAGLHERLYEAFDAGTEVETYARLAATVAPAVQAELYAEIYESLILRDDGGALCHVQSIVTESGEVLPASGEEAGFEVDWTWRMTGRVVHYAHEHRRTYRYRARFGVEPDGEEWRIGAVEILSRDEVDEEG